MEVKGGPGDGAVIDCYTLVAAVCWYRLLSQEWEAERGTPGAAADPPPPPPTPPGTEAL